MIFMFVVKLPAQEQKEEIRKSISVNEVAQKLESGEDVLLLDVRTKAEFEGSLGHIDSAQLIPIHELEKRLNEIKTHKSKTIIVICRSGNRSRLGTEILLNNGYKALNMEGGMLAWNKMLDEKAKSENEKDTEH
jgi:rhodanese-related sulfurtransferase